MRQCLGLLGLTLLVSSSCSRTRSPDALYNDGRVQLRLGNVKEALALADRGCQQWRRHPDSRPYWQFRILKAEVQLAQGHAKDAIPLLEGELPGGPDFQELAVRQRMNQGYARFVLADYPEAKRLLDEAAGLAQRAGAPALLAEVELRRAISLTRLGDPRGAERCLQTARQIAVRIGDAYLETAVFGNLGYNLLNAGRYDEAIPWFEQALAAAEATRAKKLTSTTLGNLGRCYYGLGDFDKAISFYLKAEAMAAEMGNLFGRQIWLGDLGEAYRERQEHSKAVASFGQALAVSRRLGERFSTVQWLNSLTETYLALGNLSSAQKCNQEARQLSERLPELQAWVLLNSARIAAAGKDFAAAERGYLEVSGAASGLVNKSISWQAQQELAVVHWATNDWQKAEEEFRRALLAVEDIRVKLARQEWKLSFQSSVARFYQDYVDFLMSRGQTSRALEVAESYRARVLAQKLGLKQAPFELTPARRFHEIAREMRTVLVSFWLGPRRSFAWVVDSERLSSFVLPPEAELKAMSEAYSGAILGLRDPLETGNPAGLRLYQILLAPLRELIPPGSRVLLVPDGCLHELNLETLPVSVGRPRYWIEDVVLATAPSLAVLPVRQSESRREPDSLLLIGNPVAPSQEFPPLRDVRREIENIRHSFAGADEVVFTGAAAHPGAYREARPGRFSLIHFSAHATANTESPLDSAVILSSRGDTYKLYARDVIDTPLKARLVTISACRGAGAKLYSGEGLVGFSWAFLQAGARNVIAGLWDVNDTSTAVLMHRLYQGLQRGQSPGTALRLAKLALLESAGAWRKPYYWGAFQIFTRSRPF